jgi:hypothetical protein
MLIASVQRVAELMDAKDIDASPILAAGEMKHLYEYDQSKAEPDGDDDAS